MSNVSIRDLRNRGGEILDRVAQGEPLTVTRDGRPVAVLRPYVQAHLSAEALLARWRHLPRVDPATLRREIDNLLDAGL